MIEQQERVEWTVEQIDSVAGQIMDALVRDLQNAPLTIPAVLGIMLLSHTAGSILEQAGANQALEFARDLQARANDMVANMEALANGAQEKPSDTLN